MIEKAAFSRKSALVFAALVGILSSDGGCSSSNSTPSSSASCTSDTAGVERVFATSCAVAGCHTGANAAAGMDLSGDPSSVLVGVPSSGCPGEIRVVPGDAPSSLLVKKLQGTSSCGSPMPLTGSLSSEDKACITAWIAALPSIDGGAPDAANDAADAGDSPSCTAPEVACGTSCVDPQTDANNCGSCGNACSSGSACQAGQCACAGGLAECSGSCTDTSADPKNCGSCGNACPSGASCSASQCTCPSGQKACGSACVETGSDPKNCGSCGNACGSGQVCANSVCASGCGALSTCSGLCVDTQTSASNCGSCGNACASGASCSGGQCACPAGTSACSGACINTATDPSNCGGCGVTCGGGQTCQGGACKCASGQMTCNGSCIDVQSDASNCGACGNVCALGQTCSSGTCQCGTTSVSFSGAVQPIFNASCAVTGCHTGVAPQEGMNLSAGKAYGGLVNVTAKECKDGRKRVLPGQPTQSYIIDKLMGIDLCFGTKMPKTGSVANAQIQTIANWICEGAPNN